MIYKQIGTRAFLQATIQDRDSSDAAGLVPVGNGTKVREAATYYLKKSNDKLATERILGVLALRRNDFSNAQQWLLHRLQTKPNDSLAHFFLGETYLHLGDTQMAIKQWETAGAQIQLMNLARDLIERGTLNEALKALEAVMRLNPADEEAHWLAAQIWREQGNSAQALALSEKIIEINPNDTKFRGQAAELWLEQGNIGRTLELYEEIISIEPHNPSGYGAIGRVWFQQGEYEQAINYFKTALEQNPTNPAWIFVNLGHSYAALEQWGEAVVAYDQAIRIGPTDDQLYVQMAEIQCRLGRVDEANFYYQQAISLGDQREQVKQTVEFINEHVRCPE